MKKLLLLLTFSVLTIFVQAQNKTQIDTALLKQMEINRIADSLLSKSSVKNLNEWLYKNAVVSPEKYDLFIQIYNTYATWLYNEWLRKKK